MSRIQETLAPDLFNVSTEFVQIIPRVASPEGVPPDICSLFELLALRVRDKGFDRYSARAIFHRMRWEEQIEKGNREFKINNNDSAKLARWFLACHPELPNFFETREQRE